jgi:branched-chain amino acid transport system permease protein
MTIKYIVVGLTAAVAVLLPFGLPDYYIHLMIMSGISSILALSLGLLVGYIGLVSFCQAAFFGIGAYASALLCINYHLPFWISLPLAGVITAIFGLIIGYPSLKTKGPYFSIMTLGFGQIMSLLFTNLSTITRGAQGLPGIPSPDSLSLPLLGIISFRDKTSYYFLVLVMLIFTFLFIRKFISSYFGRSLTAIRENDVLAEAMGIWIMKYKLMAFVISTFFAGLAGSLYAHYFRFISPVSFTVIQSFETLINVIFGGASLLVGPIIGSTILTVIPEGLRMVAEYRNTIYAIILLLVILFLPGGIAGELNERLISKRQKVKL